MSRRVPSKVAAGFAALALTLGGCAAGTDDGVTTDPSTAAAFPVTVGNLTLDKQPKKIVSLAATATETLFAVGAGTQVVAVDEASNFPENAPDVKGLSGFKPNAEAITRYTPDLVIISDDLEKIVESLTALKIPVFLAPASKTLDEVYAQIEDIGKLTGRGTEAADLTKRMRADIAKLVKDLPQRAKKLTYYYELDQTLFTVTSKTFVGSLFVAAGLDNIADPADPTGKGYPQLNAEALIGANPDMIFLADTKCCGQNATTVAARAGWGTVTAVKTGQIVPLDDDVASRWGPRVVDLLRAIIEAVAKVPAA